MATKIENLQLEIDHFDHFKEYLPGYKTMCKDTVLSLAKLGGLQISTLFEQALARVGKHKMVSLDRGDLCRDGVYSDAKLSTVRTSGYGLVYSAQVSNIFNKTGSLRVQVYERKQGRFYYFVIPRHAFRGIARSSNIEIPFDLDGTPRRIPRRKVRVNWWRYEKATWAEMARAA
jgi:hypothetical protein